MSERYVMGWDQGRPGGDKTVSVVYDTQKREIVSIQEWTEEEWRRSEEAKNDEFQRLMEAARIDMYCDIARSMGVRDPERYFRNPSGVDDQGDAVVVEPPALPPPEAGRKGT